VEFEFAGNQVSGWIAWPVLAVYLWLFCKAYVFLRGRYLTDDNFIAALAAFHFAGVGALFMPFVMLRRWWTDKRPVQVTHYSESRPGS
jgi:hypothetical protein